MKINNRDSFKVRIFKNLKLAGHLTRLNNIMAHKLVLWEPTNARASRDVVKPSLMLIN